MVFAARSEHHMEAFISLICGLIAAVSFCQEDKSDSLLVIADGVIHGKLIENKQQPPLELVLTSFPIFSSEDIESVEILTDGEMCYSQAKILIIHTKKGSAIKEFTLNGKSVRRRRGIELGCLLDQEALLRQMKKKWHINPKKIRSLEVNGKSITIFTTQ